MWKALGFVFAGLCVLSAAFDVAWRAFGSLSALQMGVGSGALLAVLAVAPFLMKPADADINDVGLVPMDDDDADPKGVDLARCSGEAA